LLRYFRINDPYRLVALLILLLIIYLPLFLDPPEITKPELHSMLVGEKLHDGSRMYQDISDNTGPLSAWFHALLDIFFGRSLLARHIVAFVIIFFQSAFLGIIFITKKVFNENTFIPCLIFSILYFFSFDTLSVSDELLGSGFLLLALSNLFKEIEFRMPRDETTFNLGIFLSLASLFYLPYLIFLFGIIIILFLFARTDLRKFLLLIFGFLLPHLLVITLTYLNGEVRPLWNNFYLSSLTFNKQFLVTTKTLVILGSIPVLYLVTSIVMLNRLARFSKYQSQLLQSIFLWIGFCFIYFLFCRDLRPQTLVVLIPPLTFLFTHFLLLIRRKKFAEMNTWILLAGIVTTSYMARYHKLGGVDYSNLIITPIEEQTPKGKKILVLGNESAYYVNNRTATPFINWDLAKQTFETPEYFESVTTVYKGFISDPPDVIIDHNQLMHAFLDKIPVLKNQYAKKGNLYERLPVSR
jgi:hypothetical protein